MGTGRIRRYGKGSLYCGLLLGLSACSAEESLILGFTPSEYRAVERMSEVLEPSVDSSNQWDGQASVIAFGEELFYSALLSPDGVSCASCHDPEQGFSDGRSLSEGAEQTVRHAPHLYGQTEQTWFFWDGRCDSLWCQAAEPLESPKEMNSSRTEIALAIRDNQSYRDSYEEIFGALPDMMDWPQRARPNGDADNPDVLAWQSMSENAQHDVTNIVVNIVKSIAAFEASIETPRSAIDEFSERYRQNPEAALNSLSAEQELGLRLFVGKGNCHFCHSGPQFSNGEFHNIGLGARDWLSDTDTGRYIGIESLRQNPFNRQGMWSDDREDQLALRIDRLTQTTEQLGQFKTPSLRNIQNTAPYMHGGHFDTVEEVIRFYISTNEEPIQGHREELLIEQNWSAEEIDALLRFLEML